jgi:hypothetical protein
MIALMMAARTSETSVDIQLISRKYIPEDSELHTRRRENLKSHRVATLFDPAFTITFQFLHSNYKRKPHKSKVKVKQSLYTPWRRLGGEEV